MTDERAAIAARHKRVGIDPIYDYCGECRRHWPCDTTRALALPPDPERLARALGGEWTVSELVGAISDEWKVEG